MPLDVAARRFRSFRERSSLGLGESPVPTGKVLLVSHANSVTTKLVALQAPLWWLYLNGERGLNKPMKSIKETRRQRAERILRDKFNGSAEAFATALGFSSAGLVHRMLSPTRSDRKAIGDKLARKIERAGGLDQFALDAPLEPEQRALLIEAIPSPLALQLAAIFDELSEAAQDALIAKAQRLYSREHPHKSVANPFAEAPPLPAANPKTREPQNRRS